MGGGILARQYGGKLRSVASRVKRQPVLLEYQVG